MNHDKNSKTSLKTPLLLLFLLALSALLLTQQHVVVQAAHCDWEGDDLGAPTPTFSAAVERRPTGNDDAEEFWVSFTATMARHNSSTEVGHFATLSPVYDACNSTQQLQFESEWTLVDDGDPCMATYKHDRTLQAHIDDPNTDRTFDGGDFFELSTQIHAAYYFAELATGQCSVVEFSAPHSVQVFLLGDTHASFEGEGDSIAMVRQNRVKMLPTGQLEVQLRVELLRTPGTLSDFHFIESDPNQGVVFQVNNVVQAPHSCGLTADGEKCVYTIDAITTSPHLDYTGKYTFGATYNDDEADVTAAVRIWFSLQYAAPVTPPVSELQITTVASFRDPQHIEQRKNTFSTNEEAYVLQETVPSVVIPDKRLSIKEAFLCCMHDREPYPDYEVGHQNKTGCTVNDPDRMAIWSNLVHEFEPNDSNYKPKEVYPAFVYDKTGLSFELMPLQALAVERGSLLCYVHLRATYVDRGSAEMRSFGLLHAATLANTAVDQVDTLAIAPVQILPEPEDHQPEDEPEEETTSTAATMKHSLAMSVFMLVLTIISAAV